MSLTVTYSPEKRITKTSSILLSPSKRRRTSPQRSECVQRSKHSAKELYAWTFRSDATALCRIHDVLTMDANVVDNQDFYWIGHIPCRNVKIVGMLVGVQVYEKKSVYTVDDGSGVIDCWHPHSRAKVQVKDESKILKYKVPDEKSELSTFPEPIAEIGQSIEIVASIKPFHESRRLEVSEIAVCSSSNDELLHIRAVRKLHQTLYSKTDEFVIPALAQPPLHSPKKTAMNNRSTSVPPSPASSVSTSPIKAPSPMKTANNKRHCIKLRHPSRLHTHDLTANTFRIYLKHFMDYTQEPQRTSDNTDTSTAQSLCLMSSTLTPTKEHVFSDETPRQSSSRLDVYTTPRPRIIPINYGANALDKELEPPPPSQSSSKAGTSRRGFTLSYLRRVPELSLLASRVTEAVARRHSRAERQRLQESGKLRKGQVLPSNNSPEKRGPRMKRLFQWALVELLHEGSIALWDGPIRRCPDTTFADVSRLWKANTSASTAGGDSSVFSTTSGTMPSFWGDDNDEGDELSDADPDEEAYIAVTPEYFAEFVEDAIRVLVDHYQKIGRPYAGATRDGIRSVLTKDDQWQFVGTWTIDDTLEYLKMEDRVWEIGKGRWDLTE